jgi:GAF domain-containing protein
MGRGAKPAKAKVKAKPPLPKSRKSESSRVRDLEKRLAEALEREKVTGELLQEKDRALTEVLEQQTATSEILRLISSSPTDTQPVFAAIAKNAVRLCNAMFGSVFKYDGTLLHFVAGHQLTEEALRLLQGVYPIPPRGVNRRVIVDREPVNVADALDDPRVANLELIRRLGYRSQLAVPMLQAGQAIGTINVYGAEPGPFSDDEIVLLQTFADQAVIAIENVRLFTELQASNRTLTESLNRQTATGDILRVIAAAQTDPQPVFDAIAANAFALCRATYTFVSSLDGDRLHLVALHNADPQAREALRQAFPVPLEETGTLSRAVRTRAVSYVPDVRDDPGYAYRDVADAAGYRSMLSVPMLRDGAAIGAITVAGAEPRMFSDRQIELLRTFADQAVIAIENARLFKELEARNRDLTATSEVLQVISRSQTDVQPVFDTIVRNAVKLCAATFGGLQRIVDDRMTLDAQCGVTADELTILQRDIFPLPISRESATGRAVVDRAVVHIRDIRDDPEFGVHLLQRMPGFRTILAVPMLRDGIPIGALALWRREVLPFSDTEISLVQTFADQAVIAIENVRLFTELQQKNRALTEALDQQTATTEVLKVISRSAFDLQPVFDTMVESAVRLCGAERAFIFRFDGELLRAAASYNVGADVRAFVDQNPIAPGRHSISARAALERRTMHIPDVQADPAYAYALRDVEPIRTILAVPMLKGDDLVGTITIYRLEVEPFSPKQIALVETFAAQAVIAIENVRLFNETKEALERQTATSEILRVISTSPTDAQPVFDTIAQNAVRLCGSLFSAVYTFRDGLMWLAAQRNFSPEAVRAMTALYPARPGRETAAGRAILERTTIEITDVLTDPEYGSDLQSRGGWRSTFAVPVLRDGTPIGAIAVGWAEPGPASVGSIALLQTFADQAVIAIENVRLFTELEARTAELTRSVEKLQALGEVSQIVSSTLDLEAVFHTVVANALKLSGAVGGVIYEFDEPRAEFRLRSSIGVDEELNTVLQATPILLGEGVTGKAAALRAPVEVADVLREGAYDVARIRTLLERRGYRSLLAVPLLFEQRILGALAIWRQEAGRFAPEVVNVLQMFATQSALAFQNARLFLEIADKSRQLEAASRHKSEFLANMSHELRTPLNAVIGFSEVLLQRMFGELNEKQDEYLRDIYASGQHLLSLINDILDLSKIEAGRMELAPASFHLPTALENAVTLVRERAARHGIALHLDLDPQLGELVGDERKVKQVLLNLLSNAVKFTPEGGRISLKASRTNGMVEIAVTDTGIGIAPDDQAAIFEEFRQVGHDETRKQEGTGLGLTLAKKFVELHGGRIWVESNLGSGSTFTFTLPVN